MVLRQEDIFSEREDIFLRGNIFLREDIFLRGNNSKFLILNQIKFSPCT